MTIKFNPHVNASAVQPPSEQGNGSALPPPPSARARSEGESAYAGQRGGRSILATNGSIHKLGQTSIHGTPGRGGPPSMQPNAPAGFAPPSDGSASQPPRQPHDSRSLGTKIKDRVMKHFNDEADGLVAKNMNKRMAALSSPDNRFPKLQGMLDGSSTTAPPGHAPQTPAHEGLRDRLTGRLEQHFAGSADKMVAKNMQKRMNALAASNQQEHSDGAAFAPMNPPTGFNGQPTSMQPDLRQHAASFQNAAEQAVLQNIQNRLAGLNPAEPPQAGNT